MKVDILNPRLEWRRVILAPIKTGEAATPGNDRALKIAPATAPHRVRNRLGDFPIFDPDFKMIDSNSHKILGGISSSLTKNTL